MALAMVLAAGRGLVAEHENFRRTGEHWLKDMEGRDTTLFGAVGFKKYGDTDTTDYRDVWLARAGVSHAIDDKNSLGVSLRYREAITATSEARKSIMLFHTHEFDHAWKLQTHAIGGLSDSTADLAGGISLKRNF